MPQSSTLNSHWEFQFICLHTTLLQACSNDSTQINYTTRRQIAPNFDVRAIAVVRPI